MPADDPPLPSDAAAARLFAGPGEMRARCRAHDWAATPLGPVAGWPSSLRTAVDLCLGSAVASFVWWGPELVQLHNDAALAIVRPERPAALGVPARIAWADVWRDVGPLLEEVVRTGAPVRRDGLPTAPETAWFTCSYGPVRDETGAVAGVFCTALETTARTRAEAALRASEEQLRRSLEEAPIPVIMHAEDGEVLQISRTWTELTGWTLDEVPTFDAWLTHAYGEGADAVREHVHALFAGSQRTMSIDFPVRTRDGELRHWSFSASAPGTLRDGRRFIVGMALDVTERQRAEEAHRASEARYRTLVESVRDYAIFLLDAQGVVTEWPPGAERVTGFPAAEAIGRPLARFYAPEEAAAGLPEAQLAEAAATGRGEWEGWRLRRDGSRFWANEIATAVRDASGRLVGFTKISRDLTEHRLAETAAEERRLAAARDELRRALAAAEESERRRLARELHDQLGQELTAFRLGLDDAARLAAAHDPALARPNAPLARRLAQLQALAANVTASARAIALELRPPELDDVGLEGALASYVREWAARYGITADVAAAGLAGRELPGDVGSALYRITQEALTNVAKHAHATQVSVIVEQSDGEVRLIVEDDGRGFDVEATSARARRERRLGLAGMRERAALVGGTLAVETSLGGGTAVYARLPLVDPAAGGAHPSDEESVP